MPNVKKISVIIPTHGREKLLIRCLISLNSASQGVGDYEVCVVDDGSGLDGDAIKDRVEPSYNLIWRSFKSPQGRSAARNEGIRSTDGDLCVFLDSDMEARLKFLHVHASVHREHPHTVVIGRIQWPDGGSFLRYTGTRGVAKLNPGDTPPPWYFVTGNASIERFDLPEGNAFDESLPGWGGEDLDLGLRLSEAGLLFAYAPEAVSYHNFTGDLRGHISRTTLYGRKSLPVLVQRHPELKRILRLDLTDSLFWRLTVHDTVFKPVLWVAGRFDSSALPMRLFDYLTYAAYARGWLGRERP